MSSSGIGSNFSLVSEDWDQISEIDVYRKDSREYGRNTGAWKVDESMVEGICLALSVGDDRRNACALVCLPYPLFQRWFSLGERLALKVYGQSGYELSDEEEGYFWMYRKVMNAESLWLNKSAIVLNEVVEGNEDITSLQAKIALEVKSRRSPGAWERKNGVEYVKRHGSKRFTAGQLDTSLAQNLDEIKLERDKELEEMRKEMGDPRLGDDVNTDMTSPS